MLSLQRGVLVLVALGDGLHLLFQLIYLRALLGSLVELIVHGLAEVSQLLVDVLDAYLDLLDSLSGQVEVRLAGIECLQLFRVLVDAARYVRYLLLELGYLVSELLSELGDVLASHLMEEFREVLVVSCDVLVRGDADHLGEELALVVSWQCREVGWNRQHLE